MVRSTLGLPPEAVVADKSLRELGASSLQAVAVQYQILERLDLDVPMAELLSERNIAALSRDLSEGVTR
jgi:methionyl-tRNA synthetase